MRGETKLSSLVLERAANNNPARPHSHHHLASSSIDDGGGGALLRGILLLPIGGNWTSWIARRWGNVSKHLCLAYGGLRTTIARQRTRLFGRISISRSFRYRRKFN